jgi:hypothetical protein
MIAWICSLVSASSICILETVADKFPPSKNKDGLLHFYLSRT